jgi:hypothetical protein
MKWVTTLQTNQRALDCNNVIEASKSLRAFSLPTEQQAQCLARAWTPPRMAPKTDTECHICHGRFAMFRRSCHCRNCGVLICKECTVYWPSRMLPDTYNFKKENSVRVCKACDWLSNTFRLALLEGNVDKAVALHATGNLNLTCPFANVKGEEFYPVHCAVLGGNLRVLKWLVEENCCPIKSVRVSGKTRDIVGKYTAVVTSKGRSLLGIALENTNVQIVRYLVVKKGLSLYGESDITSYMLLQNLDSVLRLLPEEEAPQPSQDVDMTEIHMIPVNGHDEWGDLAPMTPPPNDRSEGFNTRTLSEEARDFGAVDNRSQHDDEDLDGIGATVVRQQADECKFINVLYLIDVCFKTACGSILTAFLFPY